MQTTTINKETIATLLQRGRTRMVEGYLYEGGTINPQQNHDYWRGFAQCAKALLDGSALVMASHDEASVPQGAIQAALARLPNDVERLTLADMKRHMWAQGVDFGSDLVTNRNVNAVVQLQDGIRIAIKLDDEHAVAGVDVQDGGEVHGAAGCVVENSIVKE